jgi:hypothetical protein
MTTPARQNQACAMEDAQAAPDVIIGMILVFIHAKESDDC